MGLHNGTKERILEAALDVFARDGYAGTNIKDIAESVGLVKSAFYRHFQSKEEIWNAVFEMTSVYYSEHFGSAEHLEHVPQSTAELYEMTMRMVNFTVHDEKIVKMRKLLNTEQFRDERVRRLASWYFLEDTKAIFEKVFSAMMEKGILKRANVDFLAFSFTAPITALIHLCDREPDLIPQTLVRIENYVNDFIRQNAAQ